MNRSTQAVTDRALAFLNQIEALTGIKPIVYTYVSFANENFDMRLADYPLWIAHYNVDTPSPTNVWGNNYVGHQYTEHGNIQGISGNVDINNFKDGIASNAPYTNNISVDTPQDNIVLQLQKLINLQGFGIIAEDGIAGNDTVNHCPTVKEGAEGEITKWIQLRVGFTGDDVDGAFGESTNNAVIGFQSSRGLDADGIVGTNTWRALLNI